MSLTLGPANRFPVNTAGEFHKPDSRPWLAKKRQGCMTPSGCWAPSQSKCRVEGTACGHLMGRGHLDLVLYVSRGGTAAPPAMASSLSSCMFCISWFRFGNYFTVRIFWFEFQQPADEQEGGLKKGGIGRFPLRSSESNLPSLLRPKLTLQAAKPHCVRSLDPLSST